MLQYCPYYFPTVRGQSLRLREGGKGAGETDPGHKLIWARQTQVVQQTVQSGQAFFRPAQPASVRLQEAVQLRPAELPQKESGDQQQQTEQLNPEEVSLSLDMICLKETLTSEVTLFRGGRLAHFLHRWKTITSDPEILGIVKGLELEFDCPLDRLPKSPPSQPRLSDTEVKVIDAEIKKLKEKAVIVECEPEPNQFVSPVFTRPKNDGSHRMILNLKSLNKHITYHHFKMDTLQTALLLVTPNCFLASIVLKDAYYSCSIAPEHRKFLRFAWKERLLEFNALPNGLALAPRKFTKLLKPVFATLRDKGHLSSAFLDDSVLVAQSRESCLQNVRDTVQLLRSLGLLIHPEKSVLEPSHTIQYLGVVINSVTMKVKLTSERAQDLRDSCVMLLKKQRPRIRDVASVIG